MTQTLVYVWLLMVPGKRHFITTNKASTASKTTFSACVHYIESIHMLFISFIFIPFLIYPTSVLSTPRYKLLNVDV